MGESRTSPFVLACCVVGIALSIGLPVTAQQKPELGPADQLRIEELREQINRHRRDGEYSAAVRLAREALKLRMNKQGAEHWQTTDSRLLVETLTRLEKMPPADSRRLDATYDATDDAQRLFGDEKFDECLAILRQVHQTRSELLGAHSREAVGCLNNTAMVLASLGRFGEAQAVYEQALAGLRRAYGEKHPQISVAYANVAFNLKELNRLTESLELHRKAIAIAEETVGADSREASNVQGNMGLILDDLGRHREALECFDAALRGVLKYHGAESMQAIRLRNNRAANAKHMGDIPRAATEFREALKSSRRCLPPGNTDIATTAMNLSVTLSDLDQFAEAEALCREAIEMLERVLPEQHPYLAQCLQNLAGCLWEQGRLEEAAELHRAALKIFEASLPAGHTTIGNACNSLARTLVSIGDPKLALGYADRALQIHRDHLDRVSVTQSERQQRRVQSGLRHILDHRLSLVPYAPKRMALMVEELWRWKGAVTSRQRAYRAVASNPELEQPFRQLREVTGQLSAISGMAPIAPKEPASDKAKAAFDAAKREWDHGFSAAHKRRESLEQAIAEASAPFRRVSKRVTEAEIKSRLPKATALIDFVDYERAVRDPGQLKSWTTKRHYAAFVVRSDRQTAFVPLGKVSQVATLATELRSRFDEQRRASDLTTELREAVWSPLEEHLDGIETVLISPDTTLGALPFGALPGRDPKQFLLHDYRIARLPMASLLLELDAGPADPGPAKGLLVVGDVNYDAVAGQRAVEHSLPAEGLRGGDKWESLPGFANEMDIVEGRFRRRFRDQPVTALYGDGATERAFLEAAARHDHLHLVTHGFFAAAGVRPAGAAQPRLQVGGNAAIQQLMPGLLSGLVLAGANNKPADGGQADGILTASEIETLDLGGVDLVVLSACETGLGQAAGGEGLLGLQRAFHVAGVRSCIASLWKVDDKATQELMSRFYTNLWGEGQSKIDALRNAQLELMRNPSFVRGDPRDRKPSAAEPKSGRTSPAYWAAFTLSGDWR